MRSIINQVKAHSIIRAGKGSTSLENVAFFNNLLLVKILRKYLERQLREQRLPMNLTHS